MTTPLSDVLTENEQEEFYARLYKSIQPFVIKGWYDLLERFFVVAPSVIWILHNVGPYGNLSLALCNQIADTCERVPPELTQIEIQARKTLCKYMYDKARKLHGFKD